VRPAAPATWACCGAPSSRATASAPLRPPCWRAPNAGARGAPMPHSICGRRTARRRSHRSLEETPMGNATADHAARFRRLHAGPALLVLPNAWDAGSARVLEKAGARAIATSSAAVAWAHGYPDGQALPLDNVVATVRAIVRVVDLPVSADIEAAYARDAAAAGATAARVIDAGVVGINV